MMPILGLDVASKTGWALRDSQGNVTSGVQSFELTRWESHGMRQLRFRKWIREMLDQHLLAGDPEEAACFYERPLDYGHKNKRPGNEAGKFLVGVLMAELEERGLTHAAPTASEVKKVATGKGNSNKAALANAAARDYEHFEVPQDFDPKVGSDEADALCVLTWGIREAEGGEVSADPGRTTTDPGAK